MPKKAKPLLRCAPMNKMYRAALLAHEPARDQIKTKKRKSRVFAPPNHPQKQCVPLELFHLSSHFVHAKLLSGPVQFIEGMQKKTKQKKENNQTPLR